MRRQICFPLYQMVFRTFGGVAEGSAASRFSEEVSTDHLDQPSCTRSQRDTTRAAAACTPRPPADPRIDRQWREIYEDVVWTLVNHREFVWLP